MTTIERGEGEIEASGAPQHEHVDCVLILVTYNSAEHVGGLLDSVPAAADGVSTRTIAVDNGSVDATLEVLRDRDDVVIVPAGENLGYSGAINLGRAHAGPCSSVLVLNPDLVLAPGAIAELYAALQEPGVGIAAPMLVNEDGSFYPTLRREPTVMRALGDGLVGARFPTRPGWLGETIRDPLAYRTPRDVAWAGGAVVLISADCHAAVGDWDEETFFLYSEETDFAARARRRGYRIRFVPSARVTHEGAGSGRSPALGALLAVNRLRYFEKYHRRPLSSLYRAAVVLGYALRSYDPAERVALRAVCSRASWSQLPGRK